MPIPNPLWFMRTHFGSTKIFGNERIDIDVFRDESQKCCCINIHIKSTTLLVAIVSLFFIISNFIAKICGYSEIGWNFELLFFIIDGIAVLSLFYGLYTENAAFLQPFVLLSIITISLLMSLAAYLGTAMIDSNSYAGQELELELNKRLSDAAKKFNMEFKFMVSMVASFAFIMVLLSIFIHFWFAYVTVQCAKYLRKRIKIRSY